MTLALYAVTIFPLLVIEHPPLLDYPNHLARLYVLENSTDDHLRKFYEPVWHLLPNLGFDVIGLALAQILPIDLVGRVFLALSFAVIGTAPIALSRALWRRYSVTSLFGFPLTFNLVLQQGFLAYLLGSGLAVWAFALFVGLARQPLWIRIIFTQIAALLLYICHLYALGIFALLCATFEISICYHAWREGRSFAEFRGLIVVIAPFIIPLLLFYSISETRAGSTVFFYQLFESKLWYMAFSLVIDPNIFSLIALSLAFLPLFIKRQPGQPTLHPMTRLSVLALLACVVLLPDQLFSSRNANWRAMLPLALIVVGSMSNPFSRPWMKPFAIATAFAATTVAALSSTMLWKDGDEIVREFDAIAESIPFGSRVFQIILDQDDALAVRPPSTLHVGARVVRRSSFSPSIFADTRHQPLRVKDPWERARRELGAVYYGSNVLPPDWDLVKRLHDFVLLIHIEPDSFGTAPLLPISAMPIKRGVRFTLYRIDSGSD